MNLKNYVKNYVCVDDSNQQATCQIVQINGAANVKNIFREKSNKF